MSDKKKDLSAQSRREDEVLNRTLIWMGGAAISILLLLLIDRYYINYRSSDINIMVALGSFVLPAAAVVLALLCAGFAALALSARKREKAPKWWVALSVFCGVLAVSIALVWRFYQSGVQLACALIPAAAVLALVYYLFQREFFFISLLSAVGLVGLWLVRQAGGSHPAFLYGYLFLAGVVLAAAACLTRKLQKDRGLWKDKRVLSKNAAYPLIYATCAIMAVLLLAAVVSGAGLAYYLLFPAVGWLVVMAVYFTVKLM